MKRTSLAALALLAACAPAATPAAPSGGPAPAAATAALNPLGMYQFATEVESETVTGSIEVTGVPGAYGGYVRSPAGEFPISGVTVTGQQMVVKAETPGGELTIAMNFTGSAYTGRWAMDGDMGDIRGQRAP
jgi:hypothetical protein